MIIHYSGTYHFYRLCAVLVVLNFEGLLVGWMVGLVFVFPFFVLHFKLCPGD